MNVFNQNLTEKEKNMALKNKFHPLTKKRDNRKMHPDYNITLVHQKSKSYHNGTFSGNANLNLNQEDDSLEEKFMHEKSSSININNNKLLDNFDENNNSLILKHNNLPTYNNELLDFNISDEKFVKFLDRYLNYMEKNGEILQKDESIYNALNEKDGTHLFKKILHKYKKKCFEYQNLQKNFFNQLKNFKSTEKNLQKVTILFFIGSFVIVFLLQKIFQRDQQIIALNQELKLSGQKYKISQSLLIKSKIENEKKEIKLKNFLNE